MLSPRRCFLILAAYLAPCLLVACAAPFVGSAETTPTIFWQLRVPRVLLGFLAGGTLAMAGAALQVVLRNPLAEPYLLGISSGGGVAPQAEVNSARVTKMATVAMKEVLLRLATVISSAPSHMLP